MLKDLWSLVSKILIIAAIVISVVFLAELLRLFVFFYRLHPILGIAYAILLAGGSLALLIMFIRSCRRHPRVLTPPLMPPLDEAGHTEMREYSKYLSKYLERLAENETLERDEQELAEDGIDYIRDTLKAHPLNDDLRRAITKTESEAIGPLLKSLSKQSTKEVRRCVRDVMIGVTLNPYPSIDLLIVIYRNMAMVTRIVGVYRSRPSLREQFGILKDILMVVATVNFINLNRKLLENLFSQIPIVGRFIDDIGQGVGAGILTSVAGHAAIDRCSAFRRWNSEEEAASLGARSARFLVDVKDLFTKDMLPELKPKIRSELPEEKAEDPGVWDAIARGTASAMDLTVRAWDSFVRKPAVAGAQGVATAGTRLARGVVRGGSSVARVSARGGQSVFRGITRVFKTFGQRIKYTFLSKRMTR